MAAIANTVGRVSCMAIGAFVNQCHTGQSVADIGYFTVGLILLAFLIWAFLGRPTGR
jgi:hypothetical protein